MTTESLQIGQDGWKYWIDISDFAVGMYYLHLQTNKGIAVEKVLIVR